MTARAPDSTTGSHPAGFGAPSDADEAANRAERLADLQRGERIMTRVRYAAVAFALLQTFAYRPPPDVVMPPNIRAGGVAIAILLAVGATVAMLANRRVQSLEGVQRLALATLAMDVVVASGFVWLFSFDPVSALWAILFILPLEGAVRFQMRGAIGSWAAVTALYVGREFFAAERYGFGVEPESISFRMGINLLIAIVAGSMASDLVGQRAQVAASLHQLARIDVLRRHLVSTLAHDVRGPLTTIRGSIRTILDRPDVSDVNRHRLLVAADRQAGRLQYLAADLLDLARLEQGRLELDVQRVRLLDAVRSSSSYVDHESQFELDIDPGLEVLADPNRLEQVVVNITANALRYGRPPYRIVATRAGESVKVAFCDSGPGVPESKRDQLFEPFSSADDSPGSVGLGLWVCQILLEAQAGSLSYRFEPDAGSVFEVTMQVASSDGGGLSGAPAQAAQSP